MPIIHQGKVLTEVNLKDVKKIEIKPNHAVVTARRNDKTIVKKYPYKFFMNGKEVKMDDNLHESINTIIKNL